MGYKALITLDLIDVTKEERNLFYSELENEKWVKIDSLTTSWKVSFKENTTRLAAIKIIKNDLIKAKKRSVIKKVEYALQLAKVTITIENL